MHDSKQDNYEKLKQLVSEDKIFLLPHKKFKGAQQISVYAKCGMSLKYFEEAYNSGDVILQMGELGPRVGYPVSWEKALSDYLSGTF